MSEQMIWEIVGYFGSALVLVSLLMSSIVKLRIINAIGSFIFCVYAFKIHSIPTAFMNIALVGIDLYFLFRLSKPQAAFTVLKTGTADSTVRYITDNFGEDMKKYFDTCDVSTADEVYITFVGGSIAGISAGFKRGGTLELLVDYSLPQYRDCKVGHNLYDFLSAEYSVLAYTGRNGAHIEYLKKMGFERRDGAYFLALNR